MAIAESGEMYLETILVLSEKSEIVRACDICEYMGFSKPSVSRAMSNLREGGYIIREDNGNLVLTDKGREIAEKIYNRHTLISSLLESLGVSREAAVRDACKIEHDISDETFEALQRHSDEHRKK